MELAFLLRGVGTEVVWITNQKPLESDEVVYSLERKMLDRGVQVTFIFLNFIHVIMNKAVFNQRKCFSMLLLHYCSIKNLEFDQECHRNRGFNSGKSLITVMRNL